MESGGWSWTTAACADASASLVLQLDDIFDGAGRQPPQYWLAVRVRASRPCAVPCLGGLPPRWPRFKRLAWSWFDPVVSGVWQVVEVVKRHVPL
jgi:hypothetical protein